MLTLALMVPMAAAGLYNAPPEGAEGVTVLVCPDDPACSAVIDELQRLHPRAIYVGVDSLLALNLVKGGDATSRADTFAASLDSAKSAFAEERWTDTNRALDEAARALAGWTGAPTNQQLFDLYYLRAAAQLAVKKEATEAFQQAAVVAWNRSVTLPVDSEPYASLYYNAVYELLTEGLGLLTLEAAPGTAYLLDGVPLGEGPLTVSVFSGTHRLNAVAARPSQAQAGQAQAGQAQAGAQWRASVKVLAFRTTTLTAQLAMPDDAGWLSSNLQRAVDDRRLEADTAALVRDWCAHYELSQVHIVVASQGVAGLDGAGLHARGVYYNPQLKRFSAE